MFMPRKYSFQPDSKDVLKSKGDVEFSASLVFDTNPNEARSELEKLTVQVGFVDYIWSAEVFVCLTNEETYRTFNNSLEKHQNKAGMPGYTNAGYRETKPATVPDSLKKYFRDIRLDVNADMNQVLD